VKRNARRTRAFRRSCQIGDHRRSRIRAARYCSDYRFILDVRSNAGIFTAFFAGPTSVGRGFCGIRGRGVLRRGSPEPSSCVARGRAHIQTSNLRPPIIAYERVDRTRVEVAPDRRVRPDILVRGLNRGFATFCLLIVSLLPLDAAAQITEALLPYPAAPRTPQEQPSEFAPIGLRLGDFFWFPRGELDEAYNSNIFATATRPTYDFITALTPSFDLLSNFPRNSLNLRAASLLQVYADHPAQNTQDGIVTADGKLDVTAGSYLYGTVQAAHQHISYGSPNSPGNIAQPVTYWGYNATAGYVQAGRRFSYEVDVGVSAAQYNAAPLVGGGVLPQSTQDGTATSAAVTGRYEIIPDYLGYIRVGYSLFDYWHTVPASAADVPPASAAGVPETRPNFSTYRVDLGLQILPRHLISGTAYVGYLVQNFASSGLGSTSSPDYGGQLVWSITPLTTLALSGLLTFNTGTPGVGLASPGTFLTSAGTFLPSAGNSYLSKVFTATASHQLLPNLQLSLTASYENDSFQGMTRTDNVFFVDAGVRYQTNRNLYLGSDFSYNERTSTASGLSYNQTILTLRVGTQF
jgi:hypothetical protein